MSSNITIKRGNDGFGSQLFSIISGIAYAEVMNLNYLHSEIENIKLVNDINFQNLELNKCNELINGIIKNLNLKHITDSDLVVVRPFFHDIISKEGVDKYFNEEFLKKLQNSYISNKPIYYNNNETNIAIHIRRGADILDNDKTHRWINGDLYSKMIIKLNKVYPDAKIHVFSWEQPDLIDFNENIKQKLVYHISDNGGVFIEDFNALIHSDILIVGSSTFSLCAGLFNKNLVLCDETIFKLINTPFPTDWIEYFSKILKNNTSDNFKFWGKT